MTENLTLGDYLRQTWNECRRSAESIHVEVLDIEQATIFQEFITKGTYFVKHFLGTKVIPQLSGAVIRQRCWADFREAPTIETGSFQKFYSTNL